MNDGFQKICAVKDLSEGYGKRFIVDEPEITDIAVYKKDGKIFAMSNVCPHQHSALIYDGYIDNGCVVCPVHGWMFDLATGKTPSGVGKLAVYEVKLIDENVFVKVTKKWNW